MDPARRQAFLSDWTAKLTADIAATVQRIKHVVEKN